MRLICPAPTTACDLESIAFTRWLLRRRKWLLPPFVRISLPVPVILNRFAVALWVLSLYLFATSNLRRTAFTSFLSQRGQGHGHGVAFQRRRLLDLGDILHLFHDTDETITTNLSV